MSSFDPYYTWLGIPPEEQPADHYRLLGLEPFETNPDVIQSALDQRLAFLREAQTGKRGEHVHTLLNELAAAGRCLLDAEQRGRYDESLRARQAAAAGYDVLAPQVPVVEVSPQDELLSDEYRLAPIDPSPAPFGAAPPNAAWPQPVRPAPLAPIQVKQPSISVGKGRAAGKPASQPPERRPPERTANVAGAGQLPLMLALGGGVAVGVLLLGLAAFWMFGRGSSSVADNPSAENSSPSRPPTNPSPPDTSPAPRPADLPPPVAPPPPPGTSALRLMLFGELVLPESAELLDWRQSFTLEFWLRPATGEQGPFLWLFGNRLPTSRKDEFGVRFDLAYPDSTRVVRTPYLAASLDDSKFLIGFPNVQGWSHWAVCFDAPTKTTSLFVNGRRSQQPVNIESQLARYQGLRNDYSLGRPPGPPAFQGDVAGLRVTRGVLYRNDFAPSWSLPQSTDTLALLDFSPGSGRTIRELVSGRDVELLRTEWVRADEPPPTYEPAPESTDAYRAPDAPPPPPGTMAIRVTRATEIELLQSAALLDWTQSFTLEFWIRPALGREYYPLFGNSRNETDAAGQRYLGTRFGLEARETPKNVMQTRLSVTLDSGGGSSVALPSFQGWSHIAICYHEPAKCLDAYVNGLRVRFDTSMAHALSNYQGGHGNYLIGMWNGRPDPRHAYQGDIAGLRVTRGVAYTHGFVPSWNLDRTPDTLALLDFSQANGDRVPELVGGRDGVLNGAKWIRADEAPMTYLHVPGPPTLPNPPESAPATVSPSPTPLPTPPPAVPGGLPPPPRELLAVRMARGSEIELLDSAGMIDWGRPFTLEAWLRHAEDADQPNEFTITDKVVRHGAPIGSEQGAQLRFSSMQSPAGGAPQPSLDFSSNGGNSSGRAGDFQGGWAHWAVCYDPRTKLLSHFLNGKPGGLMPLVRTLGTHQQSPGNLRINSSWLRAASAKSFQGDVAGLRFSQGILYTAGFQPQWEMGRTAVSLVALDFSRANEVQDLGGRQVRFRDLEWIPASSAPVKYVSDANSTAVPSRASLTAPPSPAPPPGANALRISAGAEIELDDTATLIDWQQPVTIEAWVRPKETTGARQFLGNETADLGGARVTGTSLLYRPYSPSTLSDFMVTQGGRTLGLGAHRLLGDGWTHWAFCFDPQDKQLWTWVNGFGMKRTGTAPGGGTQPAAHNLRLGRASGGGAAYPGFVGDVAALRITGGLLYELDFQPRWELTPTPDTLLWLDFSKPGGPQVADLTGKHHGALKGTQWIKVEDPPLAEGP